MPVARKEAMEAVISPVVHPDRVNETLLIATHEISCMVLSSWWNQRLSIPAFLRAQCGRHRGLQVRGHIPI